MEPTSQGAGEAPYPVQYDIEYPDRDLDRLRTGLRLFWAIPIVIVLASVDGAASGTHSAGHHAGTFALGAGGTLILGPLLMILFRQKYPRWWFDWNLELARFENRVGAYLALLDDRYPSTDEPQSVSLGILFQVDREELDRWLRLGTL